MKVTNEKTENRQAFLKIEVEPSEVEASTETSYRRLVKKVNIPGFRRGKASRAIFERHFGKHELFHEMLDDLVPDVYTKALKEQNLEPVAEPRIELESEEPVIIKAVVPLKPVVSLGDYKTIDLKPQPVEVTDEMINSVLLTLSCKHQVPGHPASHGTIHVFLMAFQESLSTPCLCEESGNIHLFASRQCSSRLASTSEGSTSIFKNA